MNSMPVKLPDAPTAVLLPKHAQPSDGLSRCCMQMHKLLVYVASYAGDLSNRIVAGQEQIVRLNCNSPTTVVG